MAVDTVKRLKNGPVKGMKQESEIAKQFRAPKLTKEMGLIDWSKPAEMACRQIRAMQPWPTAFTYFHRPGKESIRLMIVTTRTSNQSKDSPPGTAVSIMSGSLGVTTASSIVEILELQPAGKKKMTAAEFLRGYPILPGYRFGPDVLSRPHANWPPKSCVAVAKNTSTPPMPSMMSTGCHRRIVG